MRTLSFVVGALSAAIPLAACGDDDGGGGGDIDMAPPMIDAAPDADDTGPGCPPGSGLQAFDEAAHFQQASLGNTFDTDPGLGDPLDATTPDFAPAAPITGGVTPPDDGFFDDVTFIGAIGDTDWTAGWTSFPTDTGSGATPTITLDDGDDGSDGDNRLVITSDTTWPADSVVLVPENLQVFVVDGTLTIGEGSVVRGSAGSVITIVASQGGSISAIGTVAKPIVMTSAKATGAAAGDWGGLVLVSDAATNKSQTVSGSGGPGYGFIEGFDLTNPTVREFVKYGGGASPDDDGSCGTLRYVRIEFAGTEISTGNETNGLTVGGCGAGTDISYLQVHRGSDDGVEFFGGTASAKYVVITQGQDDGLDWDFGWTGQAQFVIVQQPVSSSEAGGFEADSNKANPDATPRSKPTLYNVTMIGDDAPALETAADRRRNGMVLRRGTSLDMANSILMHFPDSPVDLRNDSDDAPNARTAELADDGDLRIRNTYFWDNGASSDDQWPDGFDVRADDTQNDCR